MQAGRGIGRRCQGGQGWLDGRRGSVCPLPCNRAAERAKHKQWATQDTSYDAPLTCRQAVLRARAPPPRAGASPQAPPAALQTRWLPGQAAAPRDAADPGVWQGWAGLLRSQSVQAPQPPPPGLPSPAQRCCCHRCCWHPAAPAAPRGAARSTRPPCSSALEQAPPRECSVSATLWEAWPAVQVEGVTLAPAQLAAGRVSNAKACLPAPCPTAWAVHSSLLLAPAGTADSLFTYHSDQAPGCQILAWAAGEAQADRAAASRG